MDDIEAIASRLAAVFFARIDGNTVSWQEMREQDSEFGRPGRDTFRRMAVASLPPVNGVLHTNEREDVMR